MIIGILQLKFFIRGARSLKEKRQVLRSFKDRTKARYNVSVAEVDYQDNLKVASLAVVNVGTDTKYLRSVLLEIRKKALMTAGAELASDSIDFVSGELDDDAYDWEDDKFY